MDFDDLNLLANLLRKYRHAYSVPVGVRIGGVIDEIQASIDDVEAEELSDKNME